MIHLKNGTIICQVSASFYVKSPLEGVSNRFLGTKSFSGKELQGQTLMVACTNMISTVLKASVGEDKRGSVMQETNSISRSSQVNLEK